MPTQEPILRGDIMAKAEIPRDVMTFWVRGGVLRPIEAPKTGTGFKLRFEWYEANIAAIMNQLRILGVSIKGMLSVCKVYRDAIAFFDGRGATRDEVHAMWTLDMIERNVIARRVKRAGYRDIVEAPGFDPETNPRIAAEAADNISMEDELWAEIVPCTAEIHGAQKVTVRVMELWEGMPREEFRRHLHPYVHITEQPEASYTPDGVASPEELTFFWRVGETDDYRFLWGPDAGKLARTDGAKSMIAIDVTAVLRSTWRTPEGGASA